MTPVELIDGRGGRGRVRSKFIQPRESLALCKSFNTLHPILPFTVNTYIMYICTYCILQTSLTRIMKLEGQGHRWILKGLCNEMNYFLMVLKIKSVLPANESLRRTSLHLSLSAKSCFYLPALTVGIFKGRIEAHKPFELPPVMLGCGGGFWCCFR